MYKAVGILCILVGCIGWGNGRVGQERERILQLRALLRMLGRMRKEILYGKHTLPQICLFLSTEKETCYQSCLGRIYEQVTAGNGTGFLQIWEKEMTDCLKKLPLREDEREMLVRLPDMPDFREEKGQADRIGETEAFLRVRCRQAEEAYENRARMIRSISVLTGLLLGILLL